MTIFRMTYAAAMGAMIVLISISCQSTRGAKTDGITGATPQYTQKDSVLPPDAGEYEVLGALPGLKKYVIKYDDTLYRGGEPYAEDAARELHNIGIRTIISITPNENERRFCRKHGFELVEIPFKKKIGPSSDDLKRYLDTIRTGADPFYVHCYGGTHRGGVLGVAYRVHVLGWPYRKALVEHGRLGGDLLADHTMLESVREAEK